MKRQFNCPYWRVFAWFSYSHWGMVRLPLMIVPEWFAIGMHDVDDEDFEEVPNEA